jgi:hypothetical protein
MDGDTKCIKTPTSWSYRKKMPTLKYSHWSLGPGAHTCNPSYLGDGDWQERSLRSTWVNSSWDPIYTITTTKWTGCVAQAVLHLLVNVNSWVQTLLPPKKKKKNSHWWLKTMGQFLLMYKNYLFELFHSCKCIHLTIFLHQVFSWNPFCNKAWCKQRRGKGYLDHGNLLLKWKKWWLWKF